MPLSPESSDRNSCCRVFLSLVSWSTRQRVPSTNKIITSSHCHKMWSSFWSSSQSSTTATGSASTADSLGKKAIGESSSSFPFEIVEPILIGKDADDHHGERDDEDGEGRNKTMIRWDLYSGRDKRKAVKGTTSNSVSIFKFELLTGDFSSPSSPYDTSLERRQTEAEKAAVNAIKRLRSLRHPNILSFIDSSVDNKGDGKKTIGLSSSSPLLSIVIVTESVLPVLLYLERVGGGESSKDDDEDEEEETSTTINNVIAWGVVQVSKAVAFLNRDVKLSHNNLSASCVYVSCPGNRSWKVGGFEASSPIDEDKDDDDDGRRGRRVGGIRRQDSIGLARVVWQLYNRHSRVGDNKRSPAQIPKSLHPIWIKLSKGDISPEGFSNEISSSTTRSSSLTSNPFVQVVDFFDQIQIKDERERSLFFSQLNSSEGGGGGGANDSSSSHLLSSVPRDICAHRILPSLLTALEFSASSSTPANNSSSSSSPALLLATFFKVVAKSRLSESEIKSQVVPIVVKLFVARQDRATRAILLQQCESFLPHVEESVVNSTLYPAVVSGFLDSNPTIRELTVKSMIHFAPRLSRANLSEDLMKHFSRLQAHEEEGVIRTNTIVCLGKIGTFLAPSLRQTLLVTACLRAMRDPFPPARVNGILALSACQSLISLKETATRVMPALCHLTMDTEKSVRDVAFKSLKGFLSKLEKVSEDPSLVALLEADVNSTNDSSSSSNGGSSNLVRSLGGKAFGSLLTSTSWLTSSLSSSVNSLLPFSGSSSSSSGSGSGSTSAYPTPAPTSSLPSSNQFSGLDRETTTSSSSSRASTVTGKTGERERSEPSSNKQQQPRRGGGLIDLDDWTTEEVDERKGVSGVAVESGLKSLKLIEEKGKTKETKSANDDDNNVWNNQEDDDWSKFDYEEANDNEMKKKKDEDKTRTTEVVDRRTARTTTTTTSKKKSSAPLKLGATRLSSQKKKTDDLDF